MLTLEIKSRMTLKNITQQNMADELGMGLNTFNRKLNTGNFGLEDAKIMAKVLDIKDAKDIKRIFFA